MTHYPKKVSFMLAVYPDPVKAEGYPYSALIVAKVKKEWGLFHRESGLLIWWYGTRTDAAAMAKKIGHWPSWAQVKTSTFRAHDQKKFYAGLKSAILRRVKERSEQERKI